MCIRDSDIAKHEYLSQNLHEPKYTMIGYSRGGSGQAFGKDKDVYKRQI